MNGILHIVIARKPIEGTVVDNCLQWGCGAINVDGCRIGKEDTRGKASLTALGVMNDDSWKAREVVAGSICGRFPANLILDTSAEVQENFPIVKASIAMEPHGKKMSRSIGETNTLGRECGYGDSGSAARFFFNFAEQESDEK